MNGPQIRVLLVDDDPMVRTGLSIILSSAPDLCVVGEAADGAGAVTAVQAHAPDVVLMDVRMPRVDGLAGTERIAALPRAPRIIILTTFGLDDYVLAALRAGASGFLLKDIPPKDLIQAVRVVASGDAMLSPAVTRALISQVRASAVDPRRANALSRMDTLTDRERQVLHALGRGLSNADIGRELFLSEATVKTHVSRLLTKLQLANRVQAAILAHESAPQEW